jgi:hypothetical protein
MFMMMGEILFIILYNIILYMPKSHSGEKRTRSRSHSGEKQHNLDILKRAMGMVPAKQRIY